MGRGGPDTNRNGYIVGSLLQGPPKKVSLTFGNSHTVSDEMLPTRQDQGTHSLKAKALGFREWGFTQKHSEYGFGT